LIEQYPDGLVADLARLELGLAPKGLGKETEPQRRTRFNLVLPQAYLLEQNYPNPFNPSTLIRYQLPVDGYVTLKVYNVLGQEVATLVNEFQTAGTHSITFDTRNSSFGILSSGVYLYRLQANNFIQTKAMILLR